MRTSAALIAASLAMAMAMAAVVWLSSRASNPRFEASQRRESCEPDAVEYYTNGALGARIQYHCDTRDVLVTDPHGTSIAGWFTAATESNVLSHGELGVWLRPNRDAALVRFGKWGYRTILYPLDEDATESWRKLCERAKDGRAAWQRELDVRALPEAVYLGWVEAEARRTGRYAALERHMSDLGIHTPCPALEQLWASADARVVQAREVDGCVTDGRLTRRGEQCVAGSDDDCLVSHVCTHDGRCSANDGRCVATAEDCAKSVACRDQGRCTLDGGRCVVGESDCAGSYVCKKFGDCHRVEEGRCAPVSQQDCDGALTCWGLGCRYADGICVVSQGTRADAIRR